MQIQLAVFILALITLAYGSYTDVKKRTINSFLFIPLVAVSTAFYISSGVGILYVIFGLLMFVCTFLRPDLVIYPVAGTVFIAISALLIFQTGFLTGFNLTIMAVIFLTGFQERFFGIGDIKALIAVSYSFLNLPFVTPFTASQALVFTFMPLSLAVLINVAILSLLFLPYTLFLISRKKGNEKAPLFMMSYDEEYLQKNQAKFVVKEFGGNKYMLYRTPFLVPITGGFLITVVFGIWFLLL